MPHRHRKKTSVTHGYTAPIRGAEYNPRAHGGVRITQTCSCGATRHINSTGTDPKRNQEVGPWEEEP
jgi:hypothetical protein